MSVISDIVIPTDNWITNILSGTIWLFLIAIIGLVIKAITMVLKEIWDQRWWK